MRLPSAAAFAGLATTCVVVEATPPIFVINLASRPERMELFDAQARSVGNLPYTRIDAADPEYCNQQLQAGRIALNDTYRDPWVERVMKLGEVGCALSHIRAWEEIASTVPDSEYAIVLEDDAKFFAVPEGIVERLNAVETNAGEHGVDFVYLACSDNDFDSSLNKRTDVDENFQTCGFCSWAIGYMIRSSAAQRLVADAESYRQNIIPSDEYLPIVLGAYDRSSGECREESSEECSRDDTHGRDPRFPNVRLSCLLVKEELVSARHEGFAFSDTESSAIVERNRTDDRLVILTVATDESHFGYQALRRTANTFGYKLVNIGHNQKWTGGTMKSTGGGFKLVLVKRFLDEYDDDEQIVAFTDGYDTLFQLGPEFLLGRYESHPADVVFAAEHLCWPDEEVCDRYSQLLGVTDSMFRFLNSGNYIGRVKHLKMILEQFDLADDSDDQRYLGLKLIESLEGSLDVNIGLDTKHKLFQPIYVENDDAWEVTSENSYDLHVYLYHNKLTDSHGAILHAPGPGTKHTLIGIGNYIADGYTNFYKTKHHVRLPDIEVYPLAIGLFFIGTPFEEEFIEQVLSLDVDNSQVHLYAYYGPKSRMRIDQQIQDQFGSFHYHAVSSDLECTARSLFLRHSKKHGAKFALMVDSDTIIERATTVSDLATWNETVVAGFAQREGQLWSNFWSDMSPDGWYKKGFDTLALYNLERVGLWQVPYATSLLLLRHDVFDRVARYYSDNRDAEEGDCDRQMCLSSFDDGLAIFADNRHKFATLLGSDTFAKPDALHPELYEVKVSPSIWERRYLVPDYQNLQLNEPCQDAYGGVIFTQRFCDELIVTAEAPDEWSSGDNNDERLAGGYENVPTQDIHVNQLDWEEQWTHILKAYLRPLVLRQYEGVSFKGDFNIAFVVRYWMEGQRELEPHNDASQVTTTVLLSNDFTGGGVEFTRYNCSHVSNEPGFLLMHPGKVTHNHKAHPITSGRRYVMVSFNY